MLSNAHSVKKIRMNLIRIKKDRDLVIQSMSRIAFTSEIFVDRKTSSGRDNSDFFTLFDSVVCFYLDLSEQLGLKKQQVLHGWDLLLPWLYDQDSVYSQIWEYADNVRNMVLNVLSCTSEPDLSIFSRHVPFILQYRVRELMRRQKYSNLYESLLLIAKTRIRRPDLSVEQRSSFISFQAEMTVDICSDWVLSEMKKIYDRHPLIINWDAFIPDHGPGAVTLDKRNRSDGRQVNCQEDKSWYFSISPTCRYAFRHVLANAQSLLGRSTLPTNADRVSTFYSVPKKWNKERGIAAEPIGNMFFQKGIFSMMDYSFASQKWWRNRITLHNANRGAIRSCDYRRYGTIDCSAASDSVSLKHVKGIFKNTPWLSLLIASRSTHCDVDGTVIPIHSYATMGNATCFPVECVVFTLIAQLACDLSRVVDDYPIIYGDDIVIPLAAYDTCILLLEYAGFTVNTDKSYGAGLFREACGVHSIAGTPIRKCYMRETGTSYQKFSPQEFLAFSDLLSLLRMQERNLCFSYLWRCCENRFVTCWHRKPVLFKDAVVFSEEPEPGQVFGYSKLEPDRVQVISGHETSLYSLGVYGFVPVVKYQTRPVSDLTYDSELAAYNRWLYEHRQYRLRNRDGRPMKREVLATVRHMISSTKEESTSDFNQKASDRGYRLGERWIFKRKFWIQLS